MRMLSLPLLLCHILVSAQWTQLPDLPGPAREHAIAFVSGNHLYVGTGRGEDGALNDLWRFHLINETWQQMMDLPAPGRMEAAAFAVLGRGYVLGGRNEENSLAEVWSFHPVSNAWTQRNDLPGGVRHGAVAIEGVNVGLMATGMLDENTPSNDFWKYYPSLDQWEPMPAFAGVPRSRAAVIRRDNMIVISGGLDASGDELEDAWYFDVVNETGWWLQAPDLPHPMHDHSGAGVSAAIIGGTAAGTPQELVFQQFGGHWNEMPAFPGGARSAGVAVATVNEEMVTIYFGTGSGAAGLHNDWWKISQPVGMKEMVKKEDLRIFPNPASGLLQLDLPAGKMAEIAILDLTGRKIHGQSGSGTTTIDVGDLAPGRYIITTTQEDVISTGSFIKIP
jgi:N-acetylneuraminic acid mutarotase